jgi:hypothetical protein
MLQYVSRAELVELGIETEAGGLSRIAKAESRSPTNATFVSYSSKDVDAVRGVIRVLEGHGATVYVDKKDPALTGQTAQAIATTLRSRVAACKKLIVFATENTKTSKWVPWELGLGDGNKGRANVCIFPGPDKAGDKAWLEQEYFGVYDRIIWGNYTNETKLQWLVWNYESNNATRLADWLSR